MADPFEVRMRFSSLLQHLTASSTAALKAASYALKHREMDEDLHSCILEQLERDTNSMNNKANIMYFIEVLCEASSREGHMEYVRMVQRDVLRVVDSVAPEDGSGRQNVGVVRTVSGWGMDRMGVV
jgi:CTD kinase subunit gamma